ncbi:RNA 2',3'-cyclic phosphodiesterase [Sulfobacillus acidophilus]|uniref:RNA 2',3'-cyclic phosphodiesterase n=1 Tax=Sulfobacillus acidophilus TaxID=53633 RepID=A0ABS3AVL1_9FIRM|nr:RNA 2',3'-cyclic phosphodiesterase [Sulfobacillus acidophilus]
MPEEKSHLRLFISLDIPKGAKKEIMRLQQQIKNLTPIKKGFIKEANIHLTLQFLGKIKASQVETIKGLLQDIKLAPFKAHLGTIGTFNPKRNLVKIVWLSLETQEIFTLQQKISQALSPFIIKKEKCEFKSHITLARVKNAIKKEEVDKIFAKISLGDIEFVVNEFCLKQSRPFESGAKYTTLKTFKFKQ